ncbi:hypothetical protein ACIBQ1_20605 [Nonomuraea sp. NPDC050153]|uniref:hypothetical protein n=1 Tax=Nonomuraea sp. NPDC050153 TaxID=3364359 RepID=UPI00378F79E5
MEPAEEPALDIPADALLALLAPLPYPRRMRALALHARRLAGTSQLRVLLDDLSAQDRYARRLALHMAMAARDLDHIKEVLAGPDMGLRRAALRAVRTLPVPDPAVAAAFHDAPAELRFALYRTLALAGRHALAESLLPDVHARWGAREAAALLPACGAGTVARWLPDVAHAVTSWTALAKRHPGAVMTVAELELGSGVHAWSWWRRRGAGVVLAALAEPARMPAGQMPAAQIPAGQMPAGQMPVGQMPAGQMAAAQMPVARMLALLERHELRHGLRELPATVVNALFRVDAARAWKVFADPGAAGWAGPAKAVLRHLRSGSDAEILRLASSGRQLDLVLHSLPPARRAAIFEAVAARRGGSTGLWAMPLLGRLPAEVAAAEARRMLAWHESVWHSARSRLDDPDIPLELTSYLPYEEAVGPLREAAVGGDPRRRGLARTLLLQATARTRDRAALHALLAELALRTANEQDPLRRDLLTALGDVPPALLDDSCAGTLERVAADTVEAPDSSPATQEALRSLAGRVLRHHDPATAPALTAWALGTYGRLVARHGASGLPAREPWPSPVRRRRSRSSGPVAEPHRLDLVLRAGQEHDLLAVLRPHLRAAREREDFALAVALAHALGRRAWALAELQDDLRAAVRTAPEPLAREAADLWLTRPHRRPRTSRPHRRPRTLRPAPSEPAPAGVERRPERSQGSGIERPHGGGAAEREERVVELVREDPSALTLPAVWRTLARRRTDLLLSLLDGPRDGRFGNPAWVPRIDGGDAGRWTPVQCERIRAELTAAVHDEGLPIAARLAAVQATGRITGGLDLLAAWAEREETMLAEAAVTAMAHAGEPSRAASVLVGHAGGPASRVAVAALARCCRSVAPSLLGPLLEQALTAPGSKVTLRKLAARQLGRNRPPGAVDVLLRAWADPGLHRDVRVAVASVLRTMPEDPRTLDALGDAAGRHAGELMLRTLFQAHPMEYAPGARTRYADLVRRLLMAADQPGVSFRASKAFGLWAHWYRGDLGEIIEAAATPETTGHVMEVFQRLLRAGVIRSQTLDVLARLAAAVPGEDLRTPARQRVAAIAGSLAARPEEMEPWRRRLARDAMDVLAAEPLLLPQVAALGVALLPRETDGDGLGDDLCALAGLLADRPVLAVRTAGQVVSELFGEYGWQPALPIAAALPPARRLAARGDLSGELFALMLTQAGGRRTEWAAPWRELLRDLRDSPHLEVRQEAWDTSVDRQ